MFKHSSGADAAACLAQVMCKVRWLPARTATTAASRPRCAPPPPPPLLLLRRAAAPLSAHAFRAFHAVPPRGARGVRGAATTVAAATPPSKNANDAVWDARLAELRAYAAAHGGRTDVPQTAAGWARLGQWVNKQRTRQREGHLSAEREAALRALGFEFTPYDDAWEAHYAHLEAYAAAHGGDTRVPRGAAAPPEVRALGEWLNRQRRRRSAGTLAPERAAKLEALGVAWSTPKPKQP
jgi:hypothetical protein